MNSILQRMGEYIVKSGYQVERVFLDKEKRLPLFGATVTPLKAYSWKI